MGGERHLIWGSKLERDIDQESLFRTFEWGEASHPGCFEVGEVSESPAKVEWKKGVHEGARLRDLLGRDPRGARSSDGFGDHDLIRKSPDDRVLSPLRGRGNPARKRRRGVRGTNFSRPWAKRVAQEPDARGRESELESRRLFTVCREKGAGQRGGKQSMPRFRSEKELFIKRCLNVRDIRR